MNVGSKIKGTKGYRLKYAAKIWSKKWQKNESEKRAHCQVNIVELFPWRKLFLPLSNSVRRRLFLCSCYTAGRTSPAIKQSKFRNFK
jgi:hypothetical protein